VPAFLTLYHQ
jgi:cation transport ATPase